MNKEIEKKLQSELNQIDQFTMQRIPMEPIMEYLLSACEENDYLAEIILSPEYTLMACAVYLRRQLLRALKERNTAYLPDLKVFAIAEDFYYLDAEEVQALMKIPETPVSKTSKGPAAQAKKAKELEKQETRQEKKTPTDKQLNLFAMEPQPQDISSSAVTSKQDPSEEEATDNEQETV